MGEVQYLLLLHNPATAAAATAAAAGVDMPGAQTAQPDPDDDLRVAVLKLLGRPDSARAEQLLGSSWEADDRQLLCVDVDQVDDALFPVPLACIDGKLVVYVPEDGPCFFSRYRKVSNIR